MSTQTVRPMTPKQAIGLAGANANAVNGETSFEAAQYLIQKKHLLNDHYNLLLRKISLVARWEQLIKYVFGAQLNLERLIMWPRPSIVHSHFIVSPTSEQLPTETIYYKCCQEFQVHITGEAWEERIDHLPANSNLQKVAAKFLADLHPLVHRYGDCPLGVGIKDHVELPRLKDKPPTPCFKPKDLEMSLAIDLREFLIWTLIERFQNKISDNKSDVWSPPTHKTWCLGSRGYGMGTRLKKHGFLKQTKSGDYYPLVYWVGDSMHINCEVREQGDENTGTHYVVRPPT